MTCSKELGKTRMTDAHLQKDLWTGALEEKAMQPRFSLLKVHKTETLFI